tara:strand:- start:15994 stop:17958 length:1965 start_codon:yes stop_codon:yes gene_type:complete
VELGLNLNNFADMRPERSKGTSSSRQNPVSSKDSGNQSQDAASFKSELKSKSTYSDSQGKQKDVAQKSNSQKSNVRSDAPTDGGNQAEVSQSVNSQSANGEVSQQSAEYSQQNFAEKPMGVPGPGIDGPAMGVSPVDVERVIPENKVTVAATGPEKVDSRAVDNLTRRVAWQRFLQKMKSELDVSAEEILVAFGSLTQAELAMPPEKNIDKLVASLNLDPEQSKVATQLFTNLMEKTGSRPLAQELQTSGRDIDLTVMSQREQDQRKMSSALEKMNETFFMKPKIPQQKEGMATTLTEKELQALQAMRPDQPLREVSLQSGEAVQPNLLERMSAVSEDEGKRILAQLAQQNAAKAAQGEDSGEVSETSENSDQEGALSALMAKLNGSANPASAVSTPQAPVSASVSKAPTEDTLTQLFKKSIQSVGSGEATGKPHSDKGGSENLDQNGNFQSEAGLASASIAGASAIAQKSGEFDQVMNEIQLGLDPKDGSVERLTSEDLIQKTQVMIRDGGGDVKVILQPEGLGEVAMKVSVNGDKVNVEMVTESDAAKKILEKGMADLKHHLQASQLNLESIKVDTASNMGQQLEQQFQDAQRQQAFNFMQEFRQDNQQFRQGFMDQPSARNYRSQSDAQAPEVSSTPPAKGAQGRRLNLVA